MTRVCLLIFLWHNVVARLDWPHACFISARLAVLAPLFFWRKEHGLVWLGHRRTWDSNREGLSPVGGFCPVLTASKGSRPRSQGRRVRWAGSKVLFLWGKWSPDGLICYFHCWKRGWAGSLFSSSASAGPTCFSSYSDRSSLSKCDLLSWRAKLAPRSVTSGSPRLVFPAFSVLSLLFNGHQWKLLLTEAVWLGHPKERASGLMPANDLEQQGTVGSEEGQGDVWGGGGLPVERINLHLCAFSLPLGSTFESWALSLLWTYQIFEHTKLYLSCVSP